MKLVILLLIVEYVLCQQMAKKPAPLPMTADVPYIICDVCQKAAKTLFKNVRQKRKDSAPVKLSEEDVLNIVEKTCDTTSAHGQWIMKIDVTETKDTLKLIEHTKVGKCLEECKTVQRACEEAIGDVDTDIGEILWRDELKLSTFINEVCFKLSKTCKKEVKKYKKGKRKDHKFVEMSEKEKEATKMMNNMKGMPGMPGMEMYSREDMEAMRQQMGMDKGGDSNADAASAEEELPIDGSSQKLGFFDTIKQIGSDVFRKAKRFFKGFYKKSEL